MTLVYTKNARIRLWITRAAWTAAAVCAWLWKSELFELVERSGEANLAVSLTVYSNVYVVLAGLAVPGAVLLTVVAGSLFGATIGTIVASFISTLGASLAFLGSRHLLRQQSGGAERLAGMRSVNSQDERRWGSAKLNAWDLLLLRLMPIVPFFAVNLLAGRSRLSLATFWIVSQLGMLPATFILVRCGAVMTDEAGTTSEPQISILWPLLAIGLLVSATRSWNRIRQWRSKRMVTDSSSDEHVELSSRGKCVA